MTWWVNNQISNGSARTVTSNLPPGMYERVLRRYWKCMKTNGDRWAYLADVESLTVYHQQLPNGKNTAGLRMRQIMVATVTRDAKESSPTFNRWYAVTFNVTSLRWIDEKEKADFSTLEEAKAWAQAIVGLS